jgi:phytol kinase
MKHEVRRKMLHTLLALILFVSAPFVHEYVRIGFGVGLFVFFALIRFLGTFAHIGAVKRVTFGELFFGLGVTATAILAGPHVPVFQMGMLILAFADPLAALIGIRFGRFEYMVLDEKRTIEGSLACLVVSVAILVTYHVPLVSAFTIGGLLTSIEALSLRGSDNLFIPAVTVVLLTILL